MATMTKGSVNSRLLTLVMEMFPDQRRIILALSLKDRLFRSLLEDLVLAQEALARFEALPDADQRPEIPEYRTIIGELEAEIRAYLANGNTPAG